MSSTRNERPRTRRRHSRRRIGARWAAVLLAPALTLPVGLPAVGAETATAAPAAWGDTTARASVSSSEAQSNGPSYSGIDIAKRGRYVVFSSDATNLVPDDTNGQPDIFVRDTTDGTTARVSVTTNGAQGNAGSHDPTISVGGRYVVFTSEATNLVTDDTNQQPDVFLHDRASGTTTRVSVRSDGAQASGLSGSAEISGDGATIVFDSDAGDLVDGDTNGLPDIYSHDRRTGETTRVSVTTAGAQGDGLSVRPVVSRDGDFIAFSSQATNMVPDDTNDMGDAFLVDMSSGETTRVSLRADGEQASGGSPFTSTYPLAITTDGTRVWLETESDLVDDDTNGQIDVYVRERDTATTTRISVGSADHELDGPSGDGSMSAGGRRVLFWTLADGVVGGDDNGSADLFIRNVNRGRTRLVSATAEGGAANSDSSPGALTVGGRHVAFRRTPRTW